MAVKRKVKKVKKPAGRCPTVVRQNKDNISRKAGERTKSKQDKVIAMLRGPKGTAIATIMKAKGWQQHSVRGFFAGTVRKKLKLNLVSEKINDKRIYRIKTGAAL